MTTPEHQLPPSVVAARRPAGERSPTQRGYPPPEGVDDPEALAARLAATEALLAARSPTDVGAIVRTLVRDLGGALVPARLATDRTSLPVDVSLGLGEPVVPFADELSVARMRLAVALPPFVERARAVLTRLVQDEQQA